ncbi:MAG: S8 family serine peptidase [Actinomycetota bacterium]|nr:S8 family serine peptidase [Actinomycetota bacterium]
MLLVLAGGIGRAAAIGPVATQSPDSVPGQALVRFRPGTPPAVERLVHDRAGVRVLRHVAGTYELVGFPTSASLQTILSAYRANPAVAVAEPNAIARVALAPNDPCAAGPCAGSARQYNLDMTNAAAAWSVFPGRFYSAADKTSLQPVTIAVLDTKIDAANPDFANAGSTSTDAARGGQLDLADARDWISASAQGGSAAYHGTYVAGIAAAAAGNAKDVAGIGYAARIMPLTVVDGNGLADAASLADAIVYAWQRGARVINLSLGLTADSQAVHDAIIRVTTASNPALVVAAAGNNTGANAFYPGSYKETMSVAGTSPSDTRAYCSNYNGNVSVSAPAERVVSIAPMPGELYMAPCGTSAATPQVSALAAMLFAQNPARTPAAVRQIIERTADDLGVAGRDNFFGAGRINAERALRDGDGSPVVGAVRATIPPASGGVSAITATATGARGIVRAEVHVDSPAAPALSIAAADGTWGSATEELRGTVSIPSTLAAGAHPFWIRTYDGTAWGPYSVGAIIVDRTPPSLANPTATNGVRATSQPVVVTFTSTDAVSPVVSYSIQAYADSTTPKQLVFQDVRSRINAGNQQYSWSPSASVLPGHYQIKIVVADEAGNTSAALIGTVLA